MLFLTAIIFASVDGHTLKIGTILRQFTGSHAVDPTGVECLSAVVMAINQLNNKYDGFADGILPNISIVYAAEIPDPNYIAALNAAENLAVNRDGGVHSCIGPTFTTTTKAISQIFAQYLLPQIGWNSDATFSYKFNYPYYFSTAPPDGLQGKILADMCKFQFGWNKVAIISSDDSLGSSASYEFRSRAAELGILILDDITFLTGRSSFSDVLNGLKYSLASILS